MSKTFAVIALATAVLALTNPVFAGPGCSKTTTTTTASTTLPPVDQTASTTSEPAVEPAVEGN